MRKMYSKKQIETMASDVAKEEISQAEIDVNQIESFNEAVIGALSGEDITPKDVSATGDITAPSIVETMSGYSFSDTALAVGINPVYIGVCKNGNKLTLVYALEIDASELEVSQPRFGRILIPEEIGNKIYALPDDQYNTISGSLVPMYEKGSYSAPKYSVPIIGSIVRTGVGTGKNALIFGINGFASPTYDMTKTYFLRFEITFLLSENLASQE